MNATEKRLIQNCRLLRKSGRTFSDMYAIIFGKDAESLTMCESATMLRIRKMTYGEGKRAVEALASAIAEKVGASDRYIGLKGTNSADYIVAFWAILRSGNRPYLINLQQSDAYTASVLSTLGARAVLCLKDGETASDYPCEILTLSALSKETKGDLPSTHPFGDALAITTSGTTLSQKICIYRGENFARQVFATEQIIKESPAMLGDPKKGAKQLLFLPLYHIFGFSAVYLWFCFFGATFVFPQSLAPDVLLHTARRCEVTHVFAVPLFWHAIEKAVLREVSARDEKTRRAFTKGLETSLALQKRFPNIGRRIVCRKMREIRAKLLPDSVRFCISGGSHLKSSALRLLNAIGYPLANGYGMSEIGITSVELSDRADVRMKSSIGKAFSSVTYRVGEDGHLYVKGESLAHSVIVNGEETVRDEWFDTGDLMRMEEDGRCYFVGRASDVIIGENGENLNPDLITAAFTLHGVRNFTVIGDDKGEKTMLVVELPEEMPPEAWDILENEIASCNATLSLTMQVREVKYTRDALMRPNDIKISRAYLRREIDAGRIRLFDRETAVRLADVDASDIRTTIRDLFAQILGRDAESIPGDAHFMLDLGGSSLDYYTLIGELDRAFDVKLPYESENFGYSLDDFERLVKELLKTNV